MTVLVILLAIMLTAIAFLELKLYFVQRKMYRNEKRLKDLGIEPNSAEKSHGMVMVKDKKGVIAVEKKASNWYRRLIK